MEFVPADAASGMQQSARNAYKNVCERGIFSEELLTKALLGALRRRSVTLMRRVISLV